MLLKITHPDEFLFTLLNKNHGLSKSCLKNIITRKKNPVITQNQFSLAISKNQLPTCTTLIDRL